MKKRLLITSIVMMLVIAVALSTATYAWFTSNARVEASSINLTAATSQAPAFGISWVNEDYSTALENIAAPETAFNPLVPATAFKDNDGHDQTLSSVRFATASMRQEGGSEVYNTDVKFWDTTEEAVVGDHAAGYNTAAKPYIWNDGTGVGRGHTSFYVKNLSTSIAQDHLYAFANVTGAAADLVRIAIFDNGDLIGVLGYNYAYTSASETTWASGTTYYKQVSNNYYIPDTTVTEDNFGTKKASLYIRGNDKSAALAYYGTIAANDPVLTTYVTCDRSIDLGHFNASEYRNITVYVWLDGKYLDDDTQNLPANVELSFSVTDPYPAPAPQVP